MREGQQRLDKWLWYARIIKSRTLATRFILDGHVRVNGVRITQAAYAISPGDVLTIALPRTTLVIEVLAPGLRRGPAKEAGLLFKSK
ncbi:RNA-binding S4 domain-containing protein [Microvirga sp. W0021]|uniref:RNA-binding S4 domain-containing protein n=1 Tax=Hohaiivirga grylli TaxID=3133970 RepID=A0ABV0BKX5_9HYPH